MEWLQGHLSGPGEISRSGRGLHCPDICQVIAYMVGRFQIHHDYFFYRKFRSTHGPLTSSFYLVK